MTEEDRRHLGLVAMRLRWAADCFRGAADAFDAGEVVAAVAQVNGAEVHIILANTLLQSVDLAEVAPPETAPETIEEMKE
jgi:hypothetical protein